MISPIRKARAYSMFLEAAGKPMQPIGGFVCADSAHYFQAQAPVVYKTLSD